MTTPDYVHEYFQREPGPVRLPLLCRDGTQLSVQASHMHQSVPRDDTGPYTHVEICVVPFDDGSDDPDEVPLRPEGYIPVSQVNEMIHSAGGLAGEVAPSVFKTSCA